MRRNTNRETCSFIRLNDAFRKTLLQAAKKKSRKLTDHEKQLQPRALISNAIVFFMTRRELWEMIARGDGGRPGGEDVNSILNTFFLSTAAS